MLGIKLVIGKYHFGDYLFVDLGETKLNSSQCYKFSQRVCENEQTTPECSCLPFLKYVLLMCVRAGFGNDKESPLFPY